MVRTDQLRERLKVSAEVTSMKLRWKLRRLVQWSGLGLVLFAVFLFFRRLPTLDELHGVGPSLAELPQVWLVQDWLGNVALMAIGIIIAWLALK